MQDSTCEVVLLDGVAPPINDKAFTDHVKLQIRSRFESASVVGLLSSHGLVSSSVKT